MKAYTPDTNKGRTVGADDVHHKTADQSKTEAKASAKQQRSRARQKAKSDMQSESS